MQVVAEQVWEPCRTSLASGLKKEARGRSGEHPAAGGLSHLAWRAGEEIAGRQRIGRVYVPSAEL